jgi:4-amino-4-deoxy-L-arabinose transferase-like glycosyltransferase
LVGRLRIRTESAGSSAPDGVIAAVAAAAALALHLATAGRYGYFRDELYFIACAKHLAWGYVDQPPLVAVAAWLSAPAGYALVALRALPILAAAATAALAALLAGELGGGRFARALAATAVILTPAYLLLGNTLTTTSFEPLSWTLVIYAAIRIARGGGRVWWICAAAAVAFGAYGKYSIGLPVAALLLAVLFFPERRALRTPWAGIAALLCAAAIAPNCIWQAAHGGPFVQVVREDAMHRPALATGLFLESANVLRNAWSFAVEQVVYTNPPSAIVWVAGIVAPFRLRALRDVRFISVAFCLTFAVAVALSAKGYYICGFYAALFAIGAVTIERAAAALRWTLLAAIAVVGLVAMPLSLPVLPVDALVRYTQTFGATGSGTSAHLIQPVFAEEFGWRRLASDVATVYRSLPPSERAVAAVYADTYADAGALDFYGPQYGLPPAISSQNSYYLWGTLGYDGRVLVAVGASRIDLLRRFYRDVRLVRTSDEPYRWIVEGPSPIYVCRDPIAPLSIIWPSLRWYGA